jgi:hypothetical protein
MLQPLFLMGNNLFPYVTDLLNSFDWMKVYGIFTGNLPSNAVKPPVLAVGISSVNLEIDIIWIYKRTYERDKGYQELLILADPRNTSKQCLVVERWLRKFWLFEFIPVQSIISLWIGTRTRYPIY